MIKYGVKYKFKDENESEFRFDRLSGEIISSEDINEAFKLFNQVIASGIFDAFVAEIGENEK